jgi:hypothetical protein
MRPDLHPRTLKRDQVLTVLEGGRPVAMKELAAAIYGESGRDHIARVRQQVSILRSAGHTIIFDKVTQTFRLSNVDTPLLCATEPRT